SVGRSFAWQTHQGKRNLQVSVLSRGGKTTIRVSETLRQIAGGVFGGFMGGFGGGTSGILIGIGAKFHNPALGVGLWATTVGVSYLAARGIYSATARKRTKQIRSLAEELAVQARESILTVKPKLSPPATPRLRS